MSAAPPPPGLHLGYSTNVHPGESLAALYCSLHRYTLPIKESVFGKAPCGLELRLGIGAARDLQDRAAREAFRSFLEDSGLSCFSVNAYPLLDFHSRRVKETVYQPSWAEKARAQWTRVIAEIFADLLPPGITGSISTLGGAYRPRGHGPRVFRKLADNYLHALEALRHIEERSGKRLVLAVEPEPETTFETARDLIDFFSDHLLSAACTRWRELGPKARIEEVLRRHFGANIDTCHLSVLFEDQSANLEALERAEIQVAKLHVTSAVALRNPYRSPAAYGDLRGMDEPRYFHQFCGRDARGRIVWRGVDLDELPPRLERGRSPPVVEIRSHFHVPLYLKRCHRLATTRGETEEAVRHVLRRGTCRHLVIETYTWPIIAGRQGTREKLVSGIAREYRWLLAVIAEVRRQSLPEGAPGARSGRRVPPPAAGS